MDDGAGHGTSNGPPPPPDPVAAGASVPAPPPPPVETPAASVPPGDWGTAPWAGAEPTPPAWGAPSPSAQVGWDRPPAGSNGCLKGCLVVGGILAVVALIGVAALIVLGGRIAQQIADDPDAVFGGACPFVSAADVAEALDTDVQVFSLDGLADGTMGKLLDKRLLADAPDCYVLGQDGRVGRIAVLDGGGPGAFAAARADAERFLATDVGDIGDEAFCTQIDAAGSGGVLVRFDQRVVYVSMLEQDLDVDNACSVSSSIARRLEP